MVFSRPRILETSSSALSRFSGSKQRSSQTLLSKLRFNCKVWPLKNESNCTTTKDLAEKVFLEKILFKTYLFRNFKSSINSHQVVMFSAKDSKVFNFFLIPLTTKAECGRAEVDISKHIFCLNVDRNTHNNIALFLAVIFWF